MVTYIILLLYIVYIYVISNEYNFDVGYIKQRRLFDNACDNGVLTFSVIGDMVVFWWSVHSVYMSTRPFNISRNFVLRIEMLHHSCQSVWNSWSGVNVIGEMHVYFIYFEGMRQRDTLKPTSDAPVRVVPAVKIKSRRASHNHCMTSSEFGTTRRIINFPEVQRIRPDLRYIYV